MYILLIILLLVIGGLLIRHGVIRRQRGAVAAGALVVVGTPLLFIAMSVWGEWLWFDALGYGNRFWTAFVAGLASAVVGGGVGALGIALITRTLASRPLPARYWPEAAGAVFGVLWGLVQWPVILKWWYQSNAGLSEPILGRDVTFYLFSLPFYDAVYWLLLGIAFVSVVVTFTSRVMPRELRRRIASNKFQRAWGTRAIDWEETPDQAETPVGLGPLGLSLGVFAIVLGVGHYLNSFHLLFSEYGAVAGPGWTDVHIRLPAYYVMAAVTAAAGVWFVVWGMQRARDKPVGSGSREPASAVARAITLPIASVLVVWFLALGIVPAMAQWLWVSPNEITVERPYIEHNIRFTRQAFELEDIEQREFFVSDELTRKTVENNRHLISEVRLWDPRALLATYEQFQEIRLYYEFSDVDIDRYTIGDRYRQVMISPREMELDNLPRQSQTFVNRRFKYTHGYGLTLAPVSDFTPQGLPDLLVKDLPPKSSSPELAVDRPQIYYGEHTTQPAIVNTQEAEFDYPSGDENVYNRYSGSGGVLLKNLWRKFLFGWKFDGTRFFFSGYPTAESRVQFHREIRDRVSKLAPFLVLDRDPYIVLEKGRLYWIVDAYTTSARYPYSDRLDRAHETIGLSGANYLRNSVKVVVDAYNGSVDFYVFEPDDPIIRAWDRIYPGLLTSREQMPDGLQNHVRYPEGLLAAQSDVYAKYHMTDPDVFYNQEDLWVRATEKYYANVRPVDPYYVMWEPPDSDAAEFILMQPFTPKNRQVMIGWIAGMCDGENYGRLLAYRFPKEERVLGPQQVETKIDQDRHLSGQLTLWDQRGSRVIRGNLLAIPINNTLLYVEPIYLQAEAAAYPELRLVALMHNDRLSYANTFDEALQGLLGEPEQQPAPTQRPAPSQPPSELAARANQAFQEYIRLTGEQRYREAAQELEKLEQALQQLMQGPGQRQLGTETDGNSKQPQ